MVTRMRNDVHLPEAVASLTQPLYRLLPALRVHPILVTIWTAHERIGANDRGKALTDEGDWDLERRYTVYHGPASMCSWSK